MQEGTWTISPCPHRQAGSLARELGLSEITASVLVRRGYGDPEEARAFLAGEQPLHDPFLLGDMAAACEATRGAIAAGKAICVHGDYDADGICATVLAVLTLRELGAEVPGHLRAELAQGQDGEDGRADPVRVVVAVDADRLAGCDRPAGRLARGGHVPEQERVVQRLLAGQEGP